MRKTPPQDFEPVFMALESLSMGCDQCTL